MLKLKRVTISKKTDVKRGSRDWQAIDIQTGEAYFPIIFITKNNDNITVKEYSKGVMLSTDEGLYYYLGEFVMPDEAIPELSLLNGERLIEYGESKAFGLFNDGRAGFYNVFINEQKKVTVFPIFEIDGNNINMNFENLFANLIGGTGKNTIGIENDKGSFTYNVGLKLSDKDMMDRVKIETKATAKGAQMIFEIDSLPSIINPSIVLPDLTKTIFKLGGTNLFEAKFGNLVTFIVSRKYTLKIKSKGGITIEGPGAEVTDVMVKMLKIFLTHTHNSGAGPTTPPMPPGLNDAIALITKILVGLKGIA